MRREIQSVERLLPLKRLYLQILLALNDRECHGYSLVRRLKKDHGIVVAPGNLYRTLRTMLEGGLIEESDARPVPELDDERRRYFRITPLGRRAALSEVDRLERLVARARESFTAPNGGTS